MVERDLIRISSMNQVALRLVIPQAGVISWIFGPTLEISHNPMWPHTHLVSVMVMACRVHKALPRGQDRENVIMSDFELHNFFLPPFLATVDAGALTVMLNYSSTNAQPVISSSRILETCFVRILALMVFWNRTGLKLRTSETGTELWELTKKLWP
ncbi:hypothetical protein CCR75_000253 [Bremia lactucae]|uniref:Uncharacterized protein n=1 Tax=Bremia lactucae TaxID=4779 RepID=A0A976FEB9_BRELC|nr:hypothetical protein CCR75_000253 [Bremia lactucae]